MNNHTSFLLIPDISGFTEFVNHTEINHSQHIISELLEAIIDADTLGLTVSEIEGDAVLFYKFQEVPSVKKIIEAAETMFINFHTVIKRYSTHRICNCNACSSAPQLTLKIIAHAGDITFIRVKKHNKPYGTEVIKAHKLLKNDIDNHEYLLFTESFFQEINSLSADINWGNFQQASTNYEEYGEVKYSHTKLTPLLSKVPTVNTYVNINRPKSANPITKEIIIDADIDTVYDAVSNLNLRMLWRKDIKKLIFEENWINRIGDTHVCVLRFGTISFETITDNRGENVLVYGERMTNEKSPVELTSYFILSKKEENKTLIKLEIHLRPKDFIGKLMLPLMRMIMVNQFRDTLNNLHNFIKSGQSELKTNN